jgi:hypothetical protein
VAVQPSVSDPSGVSDLPERASSRYADRPLPVLRFDFQNPWRILTDIEKYPDWSSLLREIRTYFESGGG